MNPIFLKLRTLSFAVLVTFVACQQEVEVQPNGVFDNGLQNTLDEALDLMESDPNGALLACDQAIKDASNIGATFYVGKAHWYKGYIYDAFIEDISKAYFNYEDALTYLADTDSSYLKMSILNNLGILSRRYGQYDVAINYYQQAMDLKQDLSDKDIADLHYNMGVAYNLKGDADSFDKAEAYMTRALDISERIGDNDNIAGVHNYIGLMYKDRGDYDVSRAAYRNTIRNYENEPKNSLALERVGKAYHGIGVTYMEEENWQSAIDAFQKALEYKTISSSIFVTKYDMGAVFESMGQPSKAVAVWEEAIQERHNKLNPEHVEIYSKLTNVLAMEGQFEDAVGYARQYSNEVKAILNTDQRHDLENNRIIFEDIIKEYAEFRKEVPFYQTWWFLALSLLFLAGAIYLTFIIMYRVKVNTKVSENLNRIKMEFDNLKLD